MRDDDVFRWILLAGFAVVFPTAAYYRIRAHIPDEKLDRRQEGLLILATLRPVGLLGLAGVLAWLIDPSWMAWSSVPLPRGLRWAGIAIGVPAAALWIWTFHHLGRNLTDTVVTREHATLVTSGPYRWVRHPFYLAAGMAMLANSLAMANGFVAAAGGLALALIAIRTRKEEENLISRFGDAYRDYMRRTGRFLPKIGASMLWLVAIGLVCCSATPEPPPTCEELVSWRADGVEISASVAVPEGEAGPAHCKVSGLADGAIRFELLLPEEWNGKFLMGGGGGYVGSIQNQALAIAPGLLERGYATVGTDTGHTGSGIDASWALDDPEAEENFAHRAVHRTAVTAQAIIEDYYGEPSAYSYFLGCSRGGGQALIEAQRYPDDFDGIVSLAPTQDWPGLGADFIQNMQAIYPDPGDLSTPVITPGNRSLLAHEILAACDALDGVVDGILNDPRDCDFDPAELPRCPGVTSSAECLTETQLAAIQAVYRGAVVDGVEVFPGLPFGGENDGRGWGAWVTGGANAFGPGNPSLQFALGTQFYKYLVFDDPDWSYAAYDFAGWQEQTADAARLLNSTDPDLGPFRESSGKLILGHGWSDPALTALRAIDYFEEAEKLDPELRRYFRLFLMPGVLHCADGPGPDRVDWITALEAWVERGVAPDRLLASKPGPDGEPLMTRPLCPYPEVAVYDGTGDPNQAESFSCGAPRGRRVED